MRRAFLRLILVGLLLVGQHGALSHAVWHLHDFLPAHGHHDDGGHTYHSSAAHDTQGDEHSSQAELCDLHLAFGTLLSGGGAAAPALPAADLVGVTGTSSPVWHFAQSRAVFHSRAPPVLL